MDVGGSAGLQGIERAMADLRFDAASNALSKFAWSRFLTVSGA
jgi:hypothetical protein